MTTKHETERWNQYYRQDPYTKHTTILKETLKLKTPIKSMLDIGCGYGDTVLAWANKGVFATGMDIASIALEKAQQNLTEKQKQLTSWINADWHTVDLKEYDLIQKFDLVYTFMGPSLKEEEDFRKFLRASRKYCRVGLFLKGKNSLLQQLIEKKLLKKQPEKENIERNTLYERLECLHYKYSSKKISCQTAWQAPLPFWKNYILTFTKDKNEIEKIHQELEKITENNTIKTETVVTYDLITWEISS